MPLLIIILLIRCYTALHVSTLIVISKANNMLIFSAEEKEKDVVQPPSASSHFLEPSS